MIKSLIPHGLHLLVKALNACYDCLVLVKVYSLELDNSQTF